jgi:hypothetical protein
VVHRPVRGLPPTTIALLWLVERDDEHTQAYVGVDRGRTPRSSRGRSAGFDFFQPVS